MVNNILEKVNSVKLVGVERVRFKSRAILSKLAYRLYMLAMERKETVELIANLRKDLRSGNVVRAGYVDHYTEERRDETWRKYKDEFAQKNMASSEVVFRALHVRDVLLGLIGNDPRVENVVNFGCSYGWLENEVASRYAQVGVWGVDRRGLAMSLNRREFRLSNCNFVASDILEFINGNQNALNAGILCHVNIGTYFLPTFMKKLYEAAFAGGALYVVLFEPSGVSRQTGDYYRYSREVNESVVFRGPMLLHNYANLLEEAGYEVIDGVLYAPPHPHRDFRSVRFTGRRKA